MSFICTPGPTTFETIIIHPHFEPYCKILTPTALSAIYACVYLVMLMMAMIVMTMKNYTFNLEYVCHCYRRCRRHRCCLHRRRIMIFLTLPYAHERCNCKCLVIPFNCSMCFSHVIRWHRVQCKCLK